MTQHESSLVSVSDQADVQGSPVQLRTVPPAPSDGGQASCDMQQALLPKAASGYEHPISVWKRRYTVLLVAVIAALLSADQNLLAPNLSAAAAYFGLDDYQKDTILGGYIMAAFFAVGAPAALLCGYFADKFNRVYMLAFIVVLGEAPCLCTYWVTELWQFFLVRMLTGISVGGCFPLVFSLLGDLFPVSQRAAMSAIVQIAVGGGIGGGQMLAGLLGPATNWRLPFLVMAAPTLVLAVLLLVTVEEPPRGGFEKALEGQLAAGAVYDESITWGKMWTLIKVPSNWIIIMQGLFGCLPWGVMQTYINDYLHQQKGLSVELATTVILAFGVGCAVGVIAGGAAGQALYNWRRPSMAVLTGLSVLAGVGPVMFLINADIKATGLGAALFMSALAGCLASIAGPNLRAIMINVNAPETRGVALAMQSVTDDLGKGLGPVIVAGFISRLGRTGAFNVSVSAWVPCGIMLTSLACTMSKDEDAMQAQLAARSVTVLQQVTVDVRDGSGPSDEPSGPSGNSTPSARLNPGSNETNTAPGSGFGARLPLPPVVRRVLGRGPSGKVADGSGSGVLRFKSRAVAAVGAGGGGNVAVSVLAGAESGTVEMQQLLRGSDGPSSSRHFPQQQQQQQPQQQLHMQQGVFVLEDAEQRSQPGSAGLHCRVPEGEPQQQQQQQQQPQHSGVQLRRHSSLGSAGGGQGNGNGSRSSFAAANLQRSCSQECGPPPAAAAVTATSISAAGTRHRNGHGGKIRDGGFGSGSSSGSGACSMALGEGVEGTCTVTTRQSVGVR